MNSIRLEILQQSYWQHINAEKEIAFVFPDPNHPKRKKINNEINSIIMKMKQEKKRLT